MPTKLDKTCLPIKVTSTKSMKNLKPDIYHRSNSQLNSHHTYHKQSLKHNTVKFSFNEKLSMLTVVSNIFLSCYF